ncbi:MAG: helix-turn-helix transcriptional regulator [Geobacter sp.]|nr:helix-turn-helix transcriptional regulator [Geobacter sp.]
MKQTARTFKALADETRLRILALLLAEGELCVCDIMASLQLPQSTASRHLAYLKNTGWVDDRREGVWMYYSISAKAHQAQKELIPILNSFLPTLQASVADRERLEGFGKDSNCA